MNDKKIGIIGAKGFLGKEIYKILSKKYNAIPITRENYDEIASKEKFNIIINSNGNSKKFWANNNPLEDFKLSVLSVYESIYNFNYDMYIYISSIDAEYKHIYGFHKKLAENIVKKNCSNYNIIRCGAIIGKKMKKGIIKDIMENKELFVTKESCLQVITNTEIANKLSFIIEKKYKNKLFNFGSYNNISINKIAEIVNRPLKINKKAIRQFYKGNKSKIKFKSAEEYIRNILYN